VALLSSGLSREIRLAGERLDARTMDLARLRRLHERTVESLTSGLLTLDREGRITSFNPEAQRITGCPAEEAWGRTLDELLPGASALTTGPGAPVPGGRGRRRLVVRDREGGERHLGLASSVLRDERGDASGHVVIFQDVTQVVAMERDLRRSERLAGVGQLAADIAHEIRNPLAAISGSVEMLRAGLGEGEEDQERARLMDIVLREIDRLDDLITDFLSYARPAPPRATATALAPLVEELCKVLSGGLAPGISLQVEVEPGLRVLADPTQLRQVLWNLLTNAQQAMEEGGELRVRAHVLGSDPQAGEAPDRNDSQGEPRGVEIVVADTGSGISPENLERIFDPFFTTKPGGTGLGLATVHRIVESHGGSLHVDSRPGAGAEFRVRLRAVDGAAEPAEAER
jgi:two-component system sensor histidine kinase PilS (NtrC family)